MYNRGIHTKEVFRTHTSNGEPEHFYFYISCRNCYFDIDITTAMHIELKIEIKQCTLTQCDIVIKINKAEPTGNLKRIQSPPIIIVNLTKAGRIQLWKG